MTCKPIDVNVISLSNFGTFTVAIIFEFLLRPMARSAARLIHNATINPPVKIPALLVGQLNGALLLGS